MPKRSILDELRAPFESDPFYADLERFAEERDLVIPTVHLGPGERPAQGGASYFPTDHY